MDWLTVRMGWLEAAYRPNRTLMGVMRVAYSAYLICLPVSLGWAEGLPNEFRVPGPGLPSLLNFAPSPMYVVGLTALHLIAAIWLLVGWRTGAASIFVVVVGFAEYSVAYSFGKVDHSILFQLVPLVMAAAGWGEALSLDARRLRLRPRSSGLPLVAWSVVLAFAFATAALAKAVSGWWSPQHYGARAYAVDDHLYGATPGLLVQLAIDHVDPWMWKLIDIGTLLAEGWLVAAIFSPVLFRIGLISLLLFHISVYLVLGIDFSSYLFVYLPFFLTPPRLWLKPASSWATFRTEPHARIEAQERS